jgi:predicted flap endonuclease-1-like 5' DNA nuclease
MGTKTYGTATVTHETPMGAPASSKAARPAALLGDEPVEAKAKAKAPAEKKAPPSDPVVPQAPKAVVEEKPVVEDTADTEIMTSTEPESEDMPTKPDDLTELPNIGKGRAKDLIAADITSYEQVAKLGAEALESMIPTLSMDQATDTIAAAAKFTK